MMPTAGQFLPQTILESATSSSVLVVPAGVSALKRAVENSAAISTDSAASICGALLDLHTDDTPGVAEFALRHMAAIAKRRNAYDLLSSVVMACKERSIDLTSILAPNIDGQVDDPGTSTHPFEILQAVSEARCYCQARTVLPDGSSAFFNNAAFEHDILSLDACNRAYERNEREVIANYVHADDIPEISRFMAGLFRTAACSSGGLIKRDAPERVRIFHRRLQAYMECEMRISLLIRCDTGRVSRALELTPRQGCPHELGGESGEALLLEADAIDSHGSVHQPRVDSHGSLVSLGAVEELLDPLDEEALEALFDLDAGGGQRFE